MSKGCWIGNDIVDLAEPGAAGKERDRRFMDRVFTPAERARILDAASPTIALWTTWAAKEAAYKVACKIREKVVFAHQAFEVALERHDGLVRFEDLSMRVRWDVARDYIHCVAERMWPPALPSTWAPAFRPTWAPTFRSAHSIRSAIADWRHPLPGRLSPEEQASVHSTASERVRLLARRIVEQWDLRGAEILRHWRARGWSAPVVAREGQRVDGFDVSLSHDGRFVAAAVAGPAPIVRRLG